MSGEQAHSGFLISSSAEPTISIQPIRLDSLCSPPQGPLAMNRTRLGLKCSLWRAVSLGPALLSLATGCAGPGHPVPDHASQHILAREAVALEPGTGVDEGAGVRTVGAPGGEDKSTPTSPEDAPPPPTTTGLPKLPPPPEFRNETAEGGPATETLARNGVPCRPLTL